MRTSKQGLVVPLFLGDVQSEGKRGEGEKLRGLGAVSPPAACSQNHFRLACRLNGLDRVRCK